MHPISKILCEIYKALQDRGEIFFPLTEDQQSGLDSTVKTVNADYFGVERFPTPEDKTAAYFVLIIKDHNLTDGNKRLAVFWTEVYASAMNLNINLPNNIKLDQLAVAVEQMEPKNHETAIKLIRAIFFKKNK